MDDPEISVLCPTRQRRAMLLKSFTSLLATAADSRRIEFWVAIDPDVDERLDFPSAASVSIWTAPERYGYHQLHLYYNELAARARGKWLMLWNDDALMQTKGWDAVIASQPCTQVLQPSHNAGGYAHNDFPVWPRAWTDFLGYVAKNAHVDAWIQDISWRVQRYRQIPVEILHARYDLVGGQPDQTALEARWTNGTGPGELHGPDMVQERVAAADALLSEMAAGRL